MDITICINVFTYQLGEPTLGLQTRCCYLEDLAQFVILRESYVKYGIKLAETFGANTTTAEADMRRILQLETDIAKVSHPNPTRDITQALFPFDNTFQHKVCALRCIVPS